MILFLNIVLKMLLTSMEVSKKIKKPRYITNDIEFHCSSDDNNSGNRIPRSLS